MLLAWATASTAGVTVEPGRASEEPCLSSISRACASEPLSSAAISGLQVALSPKIIAPGLAFHFSANCRAACPLSSRGLAPAMHTPMESSTCHSAAFRTCCGILSGAVVAAKSASTAASVCSILKNFPAGPGLRPRGTAQAVEGRSRARLLQFPSEPCRRRRMRFKRRHDALDLGDRLLRQHAAGKIPEFLLQGRVRNRILPVPAAVELLLGEPLARAHRHRDT